MKIQLTAAEQSELRSLSSPPYGQLPTIARFWLRAYGARGIKWPAGKLPVATPAALPGEFTIAWHSRALGPAAIAAGRTFRAFTERKDQEFQQRMQAEGKW